MNADTKVSNCKQCGIEFEWRWGEMGQRRGCCSIQCKKDRDHARYVETGGAVRWRGYFRPVAPHALTCAHCGISFVSERKKKYCSKACRATAQEWRRGNKPPVDRIDCAECAKPFLPGQHRHRFCTQECADKNRWRKSSSIRRARLKDAERERFDPLEVFNRDGWRCHLCGCKTIPHLRGTLKAKAPQLDHIIPLAKGGSHTRANTACACRKCNMTKKDAVIGQPSLL